MQTSYKAIIQSKTYLYNPYQCSGLVSKGNFGRGESIYHTWEFKASQDEVIESFVEGTLNDINKDFGDIHYGYSCSIAGWVLYNKYNEGDRVARTSALFRLTKNGWAMVALNDRGNNKTVADVISGGMKDINGVAPQQHSKGCWVSPKAGTGFMGLDSIRVSDFQKPTNN